MRPLGKYGEKGMKEGKSVKESEKRVTARRKVSAHFLCRKITSNCRSVRQVGIAIFIDIVGKQVPRFINLVLP